MLIELRVKNCFIFDEEVRFSMKADMRNKKFATNVHKENGFNVLKSAGIYGANNSGKTCLVKCIRALKAIVLNKENEVMPNLFNNNPVCELGLTFLSRGREFSYDIKYNVIDNEYIYERFSEITKDKYGNEKEEVWLLNNSETKEVICKDKELEKMISLMSKNNVLIHLVDTKNFNYLNEMKSVLEGFFNKVDIINMNNIPLQHTINIMKNENRIRDKVVDFIKNADLYLEDFKYVDLDKAKINTNLDLDKPEEKVLEVPENILDQIRLVSTYKGVDVPSIVFDSTGTKKIAALAGYIIEALEEGRILVIDELDSSIHFKLTRSIVSLFNNDLNSDAQIIFTVHDINLMDCNRLFRKEQIWFVHKDNKGVYVYSLADFTAKQGVRDTTDIIEKYRKGALGALPDPDLIDSLLDIKGNRKVVY